MSHEASGLKEDRKKVLKRAFSMASGTLTSRILGLFRDIALGALFDRAVTDAWTAAFRLPNLFRRLLGEGSLSVSLIPVFMQAQAEDPSGVRGRNLVNSIFSLLLIVLGALTLLGIIYIEPLFRLLLADDYVLAAEKWELTLRMGRIMFGFVFFVCSYAFYMGILNAFGSFGLPAAAPALLNISMLVFTFLPPEWFPMHGDGLAWGVLVGGFLQAALLLMALKARNYLPSLSWQWGGEDVKDVLRRLLPGLVGMGLLQFSTLVNLYFASSLHEGSISYIYWADRLLELPLSLISVSLGAALLPTLSEFAAKGLTEKFRETAEESFLMNLFLAWPAALGLFFLAEPIIEVLFLRGKFTVADVQATAGVLKIYAVSLLLVSCSRVLMPLYYAVKNTWAPMCMALVALVIHILLAPHFMDRWQLPGLMYSGVISAFVNAALLFVLLPKFSVGMARRRMLKTFVNFSVAGVGLVASLQVYDLLIAKMGKGLQIPALFVAIVLAVIVYFGIAQRLGCAEVSKIRRSSPP